MRPDIVARRRREIDKYAAGPAQERTIDGNGLIEENHLDRTHLSSNATIVTFHPSGRFRSNEFGEETAIRAKGKIRPGALLILNGFGGPKDSIVLQISRSSRSANGLNPISTVNRKIHRGAR
jgi:hypothetical protein